MPKAMPEAASTPEVPIYYVNEFRARISTTDVCLTLRVHVPEGDVVTTKNQAQVYISPIQAKALRDLLDQIVKGYEEAHKITLPSTFSAKPKAAPRKRRR